MSVTDSLPTEDRGLPPHLQAQDPTPIKTQHDATAVPPSADADMPMSDPTQPPQASDSTSAGPSSDSAPSSSHLIDPAMPPPAHSAPQQTPEESTALANSRKRASAASAEEGAKRGRRLFGLLTSTLQQAHKAAEAPKSGAARKREELEVKLAEKVRREREEGERRQWVERERRELKASVNRIEDSLANSDSIVSRYFALEHSPCRAWMLL